MKYNISSRIAEKSEAMDVKKIMRRLGCRNVSHSKGRRDTYTVTASVHNRDNAMIIRGLLGDLRLRLDVLDCTFRKAA